jgi:EmrB/QacA subfamily drug resistance transporter
MLPDNAPDPRRWKALALLCTAFFMVTLDASIVLAALPSIDADLGFTDADLQWMMSAYGLTYGALLLLGGRCADLLGRRRLFMVGTGVLAVSSLMCGLAWSDDALIAARALQGIAAAIITPTALSILSTTFAEGSERNKALGAWGSLGGAGGSAGWLVGGPITSGLGWEWLFFINLPVAAALLALSPRLLSESRAGRRGFDLAGATTVTAALVLPAFAVVEAPQAGWTSLQTLGLLALALGLAAGFVAIEARSASPLVPLRVLRSRTLVGGNLVLVALGMSAFGTPFVITLYGREVLGYTPLQLGASFLVTPIGVTIGSLMAQRLVGRTGYRSTTCVGLVLMAAGTLLLTRVPIDGSYLTDILPALLLFGPGIGAVFVAGSIATLAGVSEEESGLASGLNNTSFQIGTSLGVAVLSTVAVSQTADGERLVALTDGLQSAFAAAIAFPAAGLLVALLLLGADVSAQRLTEQARQVHPAARASVGFASRRSG